MSSSPTSPHFSRHGSSDRFVGVQPRDVEFLETLNEGKQSAVFKVNIWGYICVMKVFHGRDAYYSEPGAEDDLFVRESTAYRIMRDNGLCQRGVVPDFYGTIQNIQPLELPSLHMFHNDELPADAILIEYIPNMRAIDLSNYTKERMSRLRDILLEINALGILHCDVYPRNMMVVEQNGVAGQDRVLWIDFDCAQVIPPEFSADRAQKLLAFEKRMIDYFTDGMAKHHAEGKLNTVFNYYYSYD